MVELLIHELIDEFLQDGEVEEFMRMPAWRVAEIMTTSDEYKENCNLVIIDFFFRHGYLTPGKQGDRWWGLFLPTGWQLCRWAARQLPLGDSQT